MEELLLKILIAKIGSPFQNDAGFWPARVVKYRGKPSCQIHQFIHRNVIVKK